MRRVCLNSRFICSISGLILALLLIPSSSRAQQCTALSSALSIAGVQNTVKSGMTPPVLSGSVPLNLQFADVTELVHSIPGVSLRYTLDDNPIGPVLTGSFAWTWDTTTASEGSHVLSVLYVNEPAPGTPCFTFQGREYTVVVENTGVPITGAQVVPVTGAWTNQIGAHLPPRADYLSYPGGAVHSTPHPYTYSFVPPAGGVPVTTGWYSEPLVSNLGGEGEGRPAIYSLQNGSIVTETYYQEKNDFDDNGIFGSYDAVVLQNLFDGERDDSNITSYSMFVPNLDGPGFIGVSFDGRLYQLNMDGSVQTLAGWVTRRDVVPFYYFDQTVPEDVRQSQKQILIGDFDLTFDDPLDLVIDPRNHNILYLADTGNNRIAMVDLNPSPPVITTYAGVPGNGGYKNGPASTALFNRPVSLVMAPDGTMYVNDENNDVIRRIDPSGNVTTLVGIGFPGSLTPEPSVNALANSPLTYAPRTAVSFNSAYINHPLPLRFDSKGNLVIVEGLTRTIRYIDLQAQTVKTIAQLSAKGNSESTPAIATTWNWLDVDRAGNVGAKDDVLVAESVGGAVGSSSVYRIPIAGTTQIPPPQVIKGSGSPLHSGNACCLNTEFTEYPWAISIDDTEGRFIVMGFGSYGVASFHIFQPGVDPKWQIDLNAATIGKEIWNAGTVANFPYASRPAFATLHGFEGYSLLGLKGFDDLSSMTDAQLATYIQNGAEGIVPRPEITGNDLRAVIYFIRRSALGGDLVTPMPLSTDKTKPVITAVSSTQIDGTDVTVSWTTNEPTLGFAGWGTNAGAYFGWSQIESGYSTTHSVTMSNLPALQTIHFLVRSKDLAGNQSVTTDQTIALK